MEPEYREGINDQLTKNATPRVHLTLPNPIAVPILDNFKLSMNTFTIDVASIQECVPMIGIDRIKHW